MSLAKVLKIRSVASSVAIVGSKCSESVLEDENNYREALSTLLEFVSKIVFIQYMTFSPYCHFGIYLSGGNIRVTKNFLYGT